MLDGVGFANEEPAGSASEPAREDARPPCGSEIVGRDGKPMPFRCNLPSGHMGKHAQTYTASETARERTTE